MYYLVKNKKKNSYPVTNYSFKDFKSFYEVAGNLDVPIFGRYTFVIKSDNMNDVYEFVKNEEQYSGFIVYIYTTQANIDYICLKKPGANVYGAKTEYQNFMELIEKHEILFAKGVADVLYKSIDHDYEEMDSILLRVKTEFGGQEVKERDLESLVVLNKIVYPRQVLMAYLNMDRWRLQKLRRCVSQLGNDVVFWSIRKSIKKLVESKVKYLKTGMNDSGIKYVNYDNLLFMYRTFLTGTGNFKDVEMLMRLYEKGVTVNDIIQEDAFSV